MKKIEMIKAVLDKRIKIVEKAYNMAEEYNRSWLDGKICGYMDALNLLNSSEESIGVEL